MKLQVLLIFVSFVVLSSEHIFPILAFFLQTCPSILLLARHWCSSVSFHRKGEQQKTLHTPQNLTWSFHRPICPFARAFLWLQVGHLILWICAVCKFFESRGWPSHSKKMFCSMKCFVNPPLTTLFARYTCQVVGPVDYFFCEVYILCMYTFGHW